MGCGSSTTADTTKPAETAPAAGDANAAAPADGAANVAAPVEGEAAKVEWNLLDNWKQEFQEQPKSVHQTKFDLSRQELALEHNDFLKRPSLEF